MQCVAPQHGDRNTESLFIWESRNLRGSKSHNLRGWLMREFQVLRKIYGEFFFLTWLIGGTFQILHITPCSQLPTAIRLKLVLMSNLIQENRPARSKHGWLQGSLPLLFLSSTLFSLHFFFFSSSLSASYLVTIPLFMCHCAHAFSHTICIIKTEILGLLRQSSG